MSIRDKTCIELMQAFDTQHRSINQNNSPPATPVDEYIGVALPKGAAMNEAAEDRETENGCDACFRRSAQPDWRSPLRFCSAVCFRQDWQDRRRLLRQSLASKFADVSVDRQLEPEPEPEEEEDGEWFDLASPADRQIWANNPGELPVEVLQLVFSHLDDPREIFRMDMVCKQWQAAAACSLAWSSPRLKLAPAIKAYGVAEQAVKRLQVAREWSCRRRLLQTFTMWHTFAGRAEPTEQTIALALSKITAQATYMMRLCTGMCTLPRPGEDHRNLQLDALDTYITRQGYGFTRWLLCCCCGCCCADHALGLIIARAAPVLRTLDVAKTGVTCLALERAYDASAPEAVEVGLCWSVIRSDSWPCSNESSTMMCR